LVGRANHIGRFSAVAIVTLAFFVAAVGFFIVREDVEAMRISGKENILWDAVQVEIELLRFQVALEDFAEGEAFATPRMINDRFDILWSRVDLLNYGPTGARLREYDKKHHALRNLFTAMHEREAEVVGLEAGDKKTALGLIHAFSLNSEELRALSRSVLHGEERKAAMLRDNLADSSTLLSLLSALAILISFLVLIFFFREANRYHHVALKNEELMHAAQRQSQAKSQFLAMMSHELRTPLNGVLGHLALIRQFGENARQSRLVEQAERSGRQMIGLLGDILDFAAIQDDNLKLSEAPFEPAALVRSVGDLFKPVAAREGIEFETRLDASCPKLLKGDFARLRQAISHLATYILETAGTQSITLDFSYESGALAVSISFDYSKDGGEWKPDLIMGAAEPGTRAFANEALGPAVSRGLIAHMGGTIKLHTPRADGISVIFCVPAETVVPDALYLSLACRSSALEAILKAALRGENVRFTEPGEDVLPQVIMIEAGGSEEARLAAENRASAPGVFLVALGNPLEPDLFDEVIDVPIDIAAFRRARFLTLGKSDATLAAHDVIGYAS